MSYAFSEVVNDFWAGWIVAVDLDTALGPVASGLPELLLLGADGRLSVHLDHGDRAELVEERRADRLHLAVVLPTCGIELVERRGAAIAAVVQPRFEMREHIVAIDWVVGL